MTKTGILGGTFDPIHRGHIECALKVKEEFGLDRVIILPSGNPPHKFAKPVTAGATRLKLAEIAVRGLDGITVSDVEVRRNGYTYAADSLAELKEKDPAAGFFYILGEDTASGIAGWKDVGKLKDYCGFILVRRDTGSGGSFEKALEALKSIGADTLVSNVSVRQVSSTKIREALANGIMPDPELMDPEVSKYILEKGLYKGGRMTEEEIIEDLRSVLPPKRFIHSLGVAEEAVRLAEKFGADKDKARLAGLLHDCAKSVAVTQLRWIGMTVGDFSPDPAAGFSTRVLHGPLGAIVAKSRYGVTDDEVLSAISKHTTGDKQMSLLDRIVFIADYTEKNRCGGFFEEVRRLADDEGLLPAVSFACGETIKIILKRGESIDVRTVYTRNMAIYDMGNTDGAN